jgi:glutamate N-acetyltransferase/amino-acid N-acetyltransferase
MTLPQSPLALPFPDLPEIGGVTRRCVRAGYKDWDRADLLLVELAPATAVAGVFTRSACPSYEVERGRGQVPGHARLLIVNAGNSNAFTGQKGRTAVDGLIDAAMKRAGCDGAQVFISSTGVIGVPLPADKALAGLAAAFEAEPCGWKAAAAAIGTTDTFEKGAKASAIVADARVELAGIVKGSGMIAPDMATMLGYVFTDAAVTPALLQQMLMRANKETFSCITVDGDTSTSDTVFAFATGRARNRELADWNDPGADAFYAALLSVCRELAKLVVRDGEGARKFVTIRVSGAADYESARTIGLAIANSSLVKTAIAGGDANWGRVVMAVGKAGEPADRDRLSISFGGFAAARNGSAAPGYDEARLARHLAGDAIELDVDIGIGAGRATVWGCDLTHGYVSINADYRS